MLILAALAHARPTEGGLFSFDDSDVVTTLDSADGTVRVWYSTDGPNQVLLDDDDGDGLPDFAQMVAEESASVLIFYVDQGFRPTISDEGRGGSDAMDVYLVDYGGNSDGNYAAESCSSAPLQCSGYFSMENDFSGYGYSNLEEAVRVLTSHELFHAVQASYNAEMEGWFSEGTAVWAENLYDPGSRDFVSFCSEYLTDTGRSLNEPPTGISSFIYSTAIWWWYLSNRYGDYTIELLLQAAEGDTLLEDMAAIEADRGGSLQQDWSTFASWNLATGRLSGGMESYPFAGDLVTPRAEENGAQLSDDNRFYPLAATYYKLEHVGGPVWFGAEAAAPELVFALHPLNADGAVLAALTTFSPTAEPISLGDLDAGDYWLVGTNPTLAEDSTKLLFCLGSEANLAECVPPGDTAAADDTGGPPVEEPEGCGCAARGTPSVALLGLALLAVRRRRS